MIRNIILISTLFYLISCTSGDQPVAITAAKIQIPKPLQTSITGPDVAAIQAFNTFLEDLSSYQMVAAGQEVLQNRIKAYLPDSTISVGFDLHLREIGSIDTFRLIFHEYFDLYDDWSKAYLNIFSPEGTALQSKRLRELSFEGSTSINLIDNQLIEIAYHDFFPKNDQSSTLVTLQAEIKERKRQRSKRRKRAYNSVFPDRIEGTLYEYYTIEANGQLKPLSQVNTFSPGRIYPQASFRILSQAELAEASQEELRLMRSEILAEHGYIFQDVNSANYFNNQEWYEPLFDDVKAYLSDVEHYNLQLIVRLEEDF